MLGQHVVLEVLLGVGAVAARGAAEALHLRVGPLVGGERVGVGVALAAHGAHEGLLACVSSHVNLQLGRPVDHLVADVTLVAVLGRFTLPSYPLLLYFCWEDYIVRVVVVVPFLFRVGN